MEAAAAHATSGSATSGPAQISASRSSTTPATRPHAALARHESRDRGAGPSCAMRPHRVASGRKIRLRAPTP
jgi:hypothetical protein